MRVAAENADTAQRVIERIAMQQSEDDHSADNANGTHRIRAGASSRVNAFGVWHACDDIEDALLVFLTLVQKNYHGVFEDYTPIRILCAQMRV